ncbi:MAG: hypothetical protein AAGG38_10820 [Planctomycetota bacterium]
MAKFQDSVELLIEARNTSRREIEQAEKEARDLARREDTRAERQAALNRDLNTGLVGTALRATAAFGGLELGLGAVNVGAKALSGDLQGAADAVERLPVLGGFARQLNETLGYATGIRREMEDIKRISDLRAGNARGLLRITLAEDAQRRSIAARQLRLEQEVALVRARSSQKEVESLKARFDQINRLAEAEAAHAAARAKSIQISQDEARRIADEADRKAIDQLDQRILKSRTLASRSHRTDPTEEFDDEKDVRKLQSERRLIQQRIDLRGEALRLAQNEVDAADRRLEATRELNAELRKQQAAQSRAERLGMIQALDQAVKDQAAREAGLAREVEAARLRFAGERHKAERLEIGRLYGERIRAAKTATEAEHLERLKFMELEDNRRREIAQKRQEFVSSITQARRESIQDEIDQLNEQITRSRQQIQPAAENTANTDRFLTGVRQQSLNSDRALLDAQKRQLKAVEDQKRDLEQMREGVLVLADWVRGLPPVVTGGLP